MATKRAYLVSLGLAKEGRGRFSEAAKEALAKAEAEGMTFDEPVIPTEKTEKTLKVKVVGPPPEDFSDISPAAVREWASKNPTLLPPGVTVGARGRIHLSVYAAYKANVSEPESRTEREVDNYGPNPDRRFGDNIKFVGNVNGKTVEVDYIQVCAGEGGCGYSLGYCRCPMDKDVRHVITKHGMIDVRPVHA